MTDVTDPQNWNILKEQIKLWTGFNHTSYNDKFLQRRIQVRLNALKLSSYSEYAQALKTNIKEHDLLLKELTIHVTNFFRDQSMWMFLMDKVVPEILALKELTGSDTINVWSAGCSSGEEPISLAICFTEIMAEAKYSKFKNIKLKILATDYDAGIIKKAKIAEYEKIQFNELPKIYLEKYFKTTDGLIFTPIDSIKSIIQYEQDDILSEKKPKRLDLILCRNTVIYFDALSKAKLYSEFYDSLNSKGFLILGKTEILQGTAREKFELYDLHERIHRRN
jgi:chemotaxis methyl-accepting protein methylase